MRHVWLEPLVDRPLFSVADLEFGDEDRNINGPSLIRVPDWVERPLGRYYLYFASHTGRAIKMAYADALAGPWRFYEGGVLTLEASLFAVQPPDLADLHPAAKALIDAGDDGFYPHIASPDVVIDEANRSMHLYYHGRTWDGRQLTRVATSADGLHFQPRDGLLGRPYARAFHYDGWWYLMAMPGYLYRSRDGLSNWEAGPDLFANSFVRHVGLLLRQQTLFVFWTEVGDKPERIKLTTVDVSGPWLAWELAGDMVTVRRPERPWEGSTHTLAASRYGGVNHAVNQVRDPAVFVEDGVVYLAYAVAGEQGIAIGRVCGLD